MEMSFKIIVDSCCDLTPAQFQYGPFLLIPLTLSLEGRDVVDDSSFDQSSFLRRMRESAQAPKTACPSLAAYLDAFTACDGADIYVVTLSALLSGSHNTAMQALEIWREDHPEAHIHVFNSCSAAAGEVALALKLEELASSGLPFEEVTAQADRFITAMQTYFVLENLEHLRKNGRLTGLTAKITDTLKIKLLMGATPEGQIRKVGQALSIKQALARMMHLVSSDAGHKGKTLCIVHCNHPERAFYVRDLAVKECRFRDIVVTSARGVTTVYANDGGIVIAY